MIRVCNKIILFLISVSITRIWVCYSNISLLPWGWNNLCSVRRPIGGNESGRGEKYIVTKVADFSWVKMYF
jgi:hypothetical protein